MDFVLFDDSLCNKVLYCFLSFSVFKEVKKMAVPKDLLYTKEHEWAKVEGDIATIGVTDFAASQMGDVVYIELPEVGDEVTQFEPCGDVESVKTVSSLFAPVSGEVVDRNKFLLEEIDGEENEDFHPEYVNQDPYGKGWMIKVKISDMEELKNLLKPEEYEEIAKE